MPKIIGITTATPFGKAPKLIGEVAALREDVDRLTPDPKEIYKAEGLYTSGIGGDGTHYTVSLYPYTHNVELKANEDYLISIPHSLVGNGEMELVFSGAGRVTLKHDGNRYTGIYAPATDMTSLSLSTLKVNGVSDYRGEIDLYIEHLSPMAKKFGDIETVLDNIIAIQNNLIGGGSV